MLVVYVSMNGDGRPIPPFESARGPPSRTRCGRAPVGGIVTVDSVTANRWPCGPCEISGTEATDRWRSGGRRRPASTRSSPATASTVRVFGILRYLDDVEEAPALNNERSIASPMALYPASLGWR